MTLSCTGIGVSRGIAIGRAHLLRRNTIEVTPKFIPEAAIEAEVARFRGAVNAAREGLRAIREQIPSSTPPDIVEFIDTHLLMMEDSALAEAPIELIRTRRCRAEWALKVRRDALVRIFDEMDDPYLRTRKDDVDHVVNQIQKILLGRGDDRPIAAHDLQDRIILADDLTPADTILMGHQGVSAFVTEFGGPMSHTAILARSLGIPAVVGARRVTEFLRDGETLVVDGEHGVVLADADEPILAYFREQLASDRRRIAGLRQLVDKPAVTLDGQPVSLLANVELADDIDAARNVGATGVGLYRTEFLYMNRRTAPDEEEHLDTYRRVVEGFGDAPVTIRTLDLGADKQAGEHCSEHSLASNPALGLRAIRLCLKEPELFVPQVRAILRASAHGPVRLMIPMLSNIQELVQVRRIIDQAMDRLSREGLDYNPDIPIGGMIEVPAAALAAGAFARRLDFLSIGTNDLIQYTLAIDRIDDEVNYLYDPLHPSVLILIKMSIDAADAAGIPISMCGEMASEPRYTRLLLGLGLREFSMQPSSLLDIKQIVRGSRMEELQLLARKLLEADVVEQRERLLGRMNEK